MAEDETTGKKAAEPPSDKKPEHHENHEHKEHTEHEKKEEAHAHAQEHHEKPHEKEHRQEKKEEKHAHEKEAAKEAAPPSEKRDLRDSRISILLFTLAGTATGLLSSVLHSSGVSNWITAAAGVAILLALAGLMTKLFKRKLKFFYSSLFVYLLIWLVAWIFLYNM